MRVIVGISGATGTVYGVRLLSALRAAKVDTDLIITRPAERVMALETDYRLDGVRELARNWYHPEDIAAPIASGQTRWDGMVIAPCSIRSLAAIATCQTDGLLARAADVTLKQRRRLIALVRETPLHLGHLRLMVSLTEMGGVVMPPVPAFYQRPRSIDDLVDAVIGRVLDMLGVDHELAGDWAPPEIR